MEKTLYSIYEKAELKVKDAVRIQASVIALPFRMNCVASSILYNTIYILIIVQRKEMEYKSDWKKDSLYPLNISLSF